MALAMVLVALSPLVVLATSSVAASSCAARGASGCSDGAGVVGKEHVLLQVQGVAVAKTSSHSKCHFTVPPETPYYWEEECHSGMSGCWADGVSSKCRFCDYAGIACPEHAWYPRSICEFDNEPAAESYYYENKCPEIDGGLGCNADGKHTGCRLCGGSGNYSSISCPVRCTFAVEPATPYFYDETCSNGMLGCLADGIHAGCRYCGRRPFEDVPCPEWANLPANTCWFRNEPGVKHFWDDSCSMGELGCWADGIHAECRFCGGDGPFASVACPEALN